MTCRPERTCPICGGIEGCLNCLPRPTRGDLVRGGQGRTDDETAESGSAVGWLLIVLLVFAAARLALEMAGAL